MTEPGGGFPFRARRICAAHTCRESRAARKAPAHGRTDGATGTKDGGGPATGVVAPSASARGSSDRPPATCDAPPAHTASQSRIVAPRVVTVLSRARATVRTTRPDRVRLRPSRRRPRSLPVPTCLPRACDRARNHPRPESTRTVVPVHTHPPVVDRIRHRGQEVNDREIDIDCNGAVVMSCAINTGAERTTDCDFGAAPKRPRHSPTSVSLVPRKQFAAGLWGSDARPTVSNFPRPIRVYSKRRSEFRIPDGKSDGRSCREIVFSLASFLVCEVVRGEQTISTVSARAT